MHKLAKHDLIVYKVCYKLIHKPAFHISLNPISIHRFYTVNIIYIATFYVVETASVTCTVITIQQLYIASGLSHNKQYQFISLLLPISGIRLSIYANIIKIVDLSPFFVVLLRSTI